MKKFGKKNMAFLMLQKEKEKKLQKKRPTLPTA